MYLQISKGGTKAWIYRYKLDKRPRQMGLGSVKDVSLAEARQKASEWRKLKLAGKDPINERLKGRIQARGDAEATFQVCAEKYIESHKAGWRNEKHAEQWANTLRAYAYPTIGSLPVRDITTELVMKVLEPIWRSKTETASRLRGRIEAILGWATVHGHREGENPARWRGHLDNLLPKRTKVKRVQHHAALSYDKIGAFMAGLRQQEAVAAKALDFAILTATRTSEVLGAKWDEFDLRAKLWTIPAERMKAGREHRIPLSPPTIAILKEAKQVVGELPSATGVYVFPGSRPNQPLSNMAMLQLLNRMGNSDITVHGFRSTFRDWAAEQTSYPREVAEMALAHSIGDKVEAAYRRGDLFEKRRDLMNDWAAFVGTVKKTSKRNHGKKSRS